MGRDVSAAPEPPYGTLYIYGLSGEVSDSRDYFRDAFIGCWNEGDVSFLFFSKPRNEEVEAFARTKKLQVLSKNVFDYKDWQSENELNPFKVENLLFCPPWIDCATGAGEILIRIDPCVVFGTGHHFTTRSCLKGLWNIYQREKPTAVLDLGTGTGILALAAAKLGAQRVLAIDWNELAVETAVRNVSINGESERIEVKKGKAEDFVEAKADLLCANLHYQVMESLLSYEAFFQKTWYILSGLFVRDAEEVERELDRRGINTEEKIQEKNWMTLISMKTS